MGVAMESCTCPRAIPSAVHHLSYTADPGCLLDADGTILFVNGAWERIALENGVGDRCLADALVGTRWLDHVAGDAPRRVHRDLFERALARFRSGCGAPVSLVGEANGPEVARLVSTRLVPIVPVQGVLAAISVVHRTVRELPIGAVYPVARRPGQSYRNARGVVEQCSCCRRTKRPGPWDEWELVPDLVARVPPRTYFGYCPLCAELHCGEPNVE
jgi:hypothetical protein